jgi:hypothetical protein
VNVPRQELVWVDRKGSITPVGAPLLPYASAVISPDGTRLACTVLGATDNVVVYDMAQGSLSQLSSEGNCNVGFWTPDGRQVVYSSDQAGLGRFAILMRHADGSGGPRRVGADIDFEQVRLVVPLRDGPGFVYEANDGLWLAPLESDAKAMRIGSGRFPRGEVSLSPDGRWLAYNSSSSGRQEIHVRTFPEEGKTWQITQGGGAIVRWSRNGELFYIKESGETGWLCSARVSATRGRITVAPPVELFKIPADTVVIAPHPGGERFIAMRPVPAEFKGDRVEAVLNWSDQVATRAPGPASNGS